MWNRYRKQLGWLVHRNLEGPRITLGTGDLLVKSEYYWHLPCASSEEPYPVVPVFRKWIFPTDLLSAWWTDCATKCLCCSCFSAKPFAASSVSKAAFDRDAFCRISAHREGVKEAYIVPRSEEDWFNQNGMSAHRLNPCCPSGRRMMCQMLFFYAQISTTILICNGSYSFPKPLLRLPIPSPSLRIFSYPRLSGFHVP